MALIDQLEKLPAELGNRYLHSFSVQKYVHNSHTNVHDRRGWRVRCRELEDRR